MQTMPDDDEVLVSDEELRLLQSIRTWVGVPFISALGAQNRTAFEAFLGSLRADVRHSAAIH